MKIETKNRILLFIGDVFFLYISLFFTLLIRYQGLPPGFPISPSLREFFFYFSWLFLIWLFFLWMLDFYSLKLKVGSVDFFRFFSIFIFLSLLSGALYFYLQPNLPVSPKAIFILEIVIFSLLFFGWRRLFDFLLKDQKGKEKILILGSHPELQNLIFTLQKASFPYQLICIQNFNSTSEILKIIEKEKIQKVVFADKVENFKEASLFQKIEIESFTNFYERTTQKVPLSALNDVRYLEDFSKEENKSYVVLKRIFDIIFSVLGLLILAIFYPFIAIAIKIDSPGPVFFIQERVGKNRKFFRSYKFRSMYSSKREETDLWREKNKKEITRVGKFLRATHLDELPQLLNILKGDLSFVGPRPEWKKLAEKFEKEIPFYFLRYKAKPGLTGWAQLNLPPSTSTEEAKEKFQYDLYYIKHQSFIFDLVIFLKSLRKIFG
ncbi:MAG TPA: exopolysaccharide biosynthesis polyprenyl glycosylphosphotransferase [Candidatus Pacearchaeota archaeon]|nr:exopolysaccharide biosynthesis polyprenyl glycosylphosphotransferase [Candidatus Pacearchaeota archaeon]HOK94139.1 exopolysaccharide biosynthesis polyprenyl glycosylphosphotransferase [Candidatus Pacearchaeota archaeon]HPO75499.1 exopolysaccharide biosynthesis polyprenyl glycosylphosphotransferase [Candidatus Pacearchaeota archaeon]